MKVVIVAKTRMGSGACVGGISCEGSSVRLIAPDAEYNHTFNQEYNVGDVWDVTYTVPRLVPPHVENIVVHDKKRLAPIGDLTRFIEQYMPPCAGGAATLFEGLAHHVPGGPLYIARQSGIPSFSTVFWQPDPPLKLDLRGKRLRYLYPSVEGGCTLTFVGFQDPLEKIPAGTLLRVSLAHWWRPEDRPDAEMRCYVQLSGWILPQPATIASRATSQREVADQPTGESSRPVQAARSQVGSDSARRALKRVFGYDSFRPLQEAIIKRLLQGEDGLAVMPTGSGKSLCYQLPALLFEGLTVVVSPLIALMQDQVEQLREMGVEAAYLNSTLSYEAYLQTKQDVLAGRIKLLYAAPETLLRPEVLLMLEESRVVCLAIDEAHCISEWGHDFRPEYRQLAEVRRRLPGAVCLAVTATATERVREDILHSLGIPKAGQFIASFNRENLLLRVEPKSDPLDQTVAFLEAHHGEAGIIYYNTRRQVDELAAALQARGWPTLPYHAGLGDDTRLQHQRRFTHEEGVIIVATIAFGMGINKPNVRFILHYNLPKNLDSYYQQIGRAGRDGLPAECLLLFSFSDVQQITYFIQQQTLEEQRGGRWRLDAMLRFAETNGCRRAPLLAYFGEEYSAGRCESCDNCLLGEQSLADLTIPAQMFLSCVKRTGEMFGMSHIADVLRGSRSQKVLSRRHDRLSTYGIGREFTKKDWQYLARQFIQQGLLEQDLDHGNLRLTPRAYDVFHGEPVRGTLPSEAPGAPVRLAAAELSYDRQLFALLRARRLELAGAAGVPPYAIFSDRTLIEMATYFPQSRRSLMQIHGVGSVKLANFGEEFLPIIRKYCEAQGLVERPKESGKDLNRAPRLPRSNRTYEILAWYNGGLSVSEIAARETIRKSTVLKHLWRAARAGMPMRLDGLRELSTLNDEQHEQVLAAFAEHGAERQGEVYRALGEAVSYTELNMLGLYFLVISRDASSSTANRASSNRQV
jgi:ATP-dependent DNA helicase RecQ